MADNYAKLWLQNSLGQLAIKKARQQIENTGNCLPCRVTAVNGSIVTVEFEVQSEWTLPPVTIPKAESPWIRNPTQVGDKGITLPADVYLGGISGLGGGTADFSQVGNLSALVFVPVSNSGSPPIDQNAAQIQGPNGAIVRTTTGTTSEIVTDQSGTKITYGSVTVVINSSGVKITGPQIEFSGNIILNGPITQTTSTGGTAASIIGPLTVTNDVTAEGTSLHNHVHGGVQPGSGDTGPPV